MAVDGGKGWMNECQGKVEVQARLSPPCNFFSAPWETGPKSSDPNRVPTHPPAPIAAHGFSGVPRQNSGLPFIYPESRTELVYSLEPLLSSSLTLRFLCSIHGATTKPLPSCKFVLLCGCHFHPNRPAISPLRPFPRDTPCSQSPCLPTKLSFRSIDSLTAWGFLLACSFQH